MRSRLAGLVASLVPIPALADVVIVDGPAAGKYPDVPSAVAAALDGDVLLVGPGSSPGFTIDGKSLYVFAAGSAARIDGTVVIRNLAASGTVVLSGLQSGPALANGSDALVLQDNDGHVRFQLCRWIATDWPAFNTGSGPTTGGDGVVVERCPRVTFSGCELRGGRGRKTSNFLGQGGQGGTALVGEASGLALFRASCRGGDGGDGHDGGHGGDGLRASGGTVLVSGCTLEGGDGGDGFSNFYSGSGGNGGDGMTCASGTVHVLDNLYLRGAGGAPGLSGGWYGFPGIAFQASGAVSYDVVARALVGDTIGTDSDLVSLQIAGSAGDSAYLRVHGRAAWMLAPAAIGAWLVPPGSASQLISLGSVPSTGELVAAYAPREVMSARLARVDFLQALALGVGGERVLSDSRHVLVFDDTAGPDCNGNHVPDAFDIATGVSLDLDLDGVPDECP